MRTQKPPVVKESSWAPFQYPIFRILWVASVVSNIGTWMQDVGAAWLMTLLTTKPILVASVQATNALAMFLFVIPAGALADILDRRRTLIILQSGLMVTASMLSLITFFGKMTPELLLLLTFCMGVGVALSFPAWFTLLAELVPDKHLPAAVALNSVSVNLSRAIGPALAGMIIAAAGPTAVFALNALSFLGIILALVGWKRPLRESSLPAERLYGAIRAGLRYTRGSPIFQSLLIRAAAFFIFASSIWALLPLVARVELQSGPIGFGILFALLGSGAVIGAIATPYLRNHMSHDQFIFIGAIGYALAAAWLAFANNIYSACGATLLAGIAWTIVLVTIMTLVQQCVSTWVRARALSIYFAAFFGGMAFGSFVWGWVATHWSIPMALISAAIGMVLFNTLTYILISGDNLLLDQTPSDHSPAPILKEELRYEEGPIMVIVEYLVEQNDAEKFTHATQDLRLIRIRDGAFYWSLFKDTEHPQRFVECFMVESWLEHLRQHERASVSDKKIRDKVRSFHLGKHPPRVSHLVSHKLPRKRGKYIFNKIFTRN